MIRGTTPSYILSIDGYGLSDKTVYVTIKQKGCTVTKTNPELQIIDDEEGSIITFSLTQQDTLALSEGDAEIQVRFIDSDGMAYATETGTLTVGRVLLGRVIAHESD